MRKLWYNMKNISYKYHDGLLYNSFITFVGNYLMVMCK